jgi:protein STE50
LKPLPTPDLPNVATPTTSGSSLARKFSTKKLFLGGSRKPVDDSRQMEISKPLMSPTYLSGINDERRPESPRSPTKTVIPITPGLQPPTPYGSSYTPSPEASSALGGTVNSYGSAYTPTASYATSPVTPRRERKEDETDNATPRNRSNSATEKEIEKETQVTTSTSRSENRTRPSREGRSKDGVSNPMKSFRVNMDDPCWKVLPAAMKKYDVKGREEDYRLYITYGDIGTLSQIQI